MVQIVQKAPNAFENLGTGLGSGISSGLQQLANLKLQQLQQRQRAGEIKQAYESLGLPAQLAFLPDVAQKSFFQGLAERGGLGALLGAQSEEIQQEPLNELNSLEQEPVQNNIREALQSATPQQLNELRMLSNLQELLGIPQQGLPEIKNEPQERIVRNEAVRPTKSNQLKNIQNILAQPTKKELTEQRKEQFAQQKEINKETKQIYDKIVSDKDFADFSDIRIKKMKKLIEKGNLPPSGLYSGLKNLEEVPSSHGAAAGGAVGAFAGGPIGAAVGAGAGALISPLASVLQSVQNSVYPDAEEFSKLSNEFIRGAKALFGNRITNDDLRAYMATLPTLANTDQGKLAIIDNMEIANKAAKAKYKAAQKIIKRNGGNRPSNFLEQVEQEAKNELDELAKEFIS